MRTAWRICKARHAASAFDGYGAKLNGGRWNSPGVATVYTASVAAQAMLEMLVHADATILSLSYVLVPVGIEDRFVTALDRSVLPSDWADDQSATRIVGDEWVATASSVALAVPSAILNTDVNYLLNPAHADMRHLRIGRPEPLIIDDRLKRLFAKT